VVQTSRCSDGYKMWEMATFCLTTMWTAMLARVFDFFGNSSFGISARLAATTFIRKRITDTED